MSALTILLVIALICFLLGAFNVASPVNLVALGLAFVTVAELVSRGGL